MSELVFNLIAYYDEIELISFLGIAPHDLQGTDEELLDLLSARAHEDSLTAVRFLVPDRYKISKSDGTMLPGNNIFLADFMALIRSNRAHEVFEEAMTAFGVGMKPLLCVTAIFEPTDLSLNMLERYMHPSLLKGL
ncbi:MAG: hypothetical protein WC538_00370 [Thermoanaerobaculia bacterium]